MCSVDLREDSFPQKINCPVLITHRLVLRLPHVEDIEALVKLANNAYIAAQFDKMPFPFKQKDAEDFVKQAEKGQIGYYVYAITRSDTGEFIGCCGIGTYKNTIQTGGNLSDALKHLHYGPHILQESIEQTDIALQGDKTGKNRNPVDAQVFLWLGEPYWMCGYGTEAAMALVDAAFRATELETLYARARDNNAAACKILQKCGFSLLHKGGHLAEGADYAQAFAHYSLKRDSWLDLHRSSPKQDV